MSAQLYRQVKLLLGLGIALALLVLLTAIIVASDSGFSLWQKLKDAPDVLFYAYVAALVIFLLLSTMLLWRFFVPRKATPVAESVVPPTEDMVNVRIAKAHDVGIDVESAQRELSRLGQRQATGEVYVAVFGDISTGKSAIIKALVDAQDIRVGVTGGTTRSIQNYSWQSPEGDTLVLTDVPGLNEADGTLNALAQEEAIRAHIVVYVCDGDLTQSQYTEVDALLNMNKPVIVALNKTDRYEASELTLIRERLLQRLTDRARDVVLIQSGGTQEVLRVRPDGSEEWLERETNPDLSALRAAVQRIIDREPGVIENLRDGNVFMLVAHKLELSELAYRKTQAEGIVKSYTRKAIVGALAAVSPGTDILIQGYLATSMLKELCGVFEVPVRKLDIERFLDLSQSHLGKTAPLLLAVAGNGLKAFPGVGTLVGGVVHAVAYGIIFDALGRSVVQALEKRGDLLPVPTMELFKENLSDDLEARTKRFIQLALQVADDKR